MGKLNELIDSKLSDIALKLPSMVHSDPASFSCGYNTGYKNFLLYIERFFEECADLSEEFKNVYFKSRWEKDE